VAQVHLAAQPLGAPVGLEERQLVVAAGLVDLVLVGVDHVDLVDGFDRCGHLGQGVGV
jgi:hypothetical protein